MANETLARRYAQAIFDLATDGGKVAEVGRDLRMASTAIAEDPAVNRFFGSPVVDRTEKQKILIDGFSGKVEELALHALLLLVRKRRERILGEIVTQYEALEQAARGAEPLTIVSARELPQNELAFMVSRLSKIYGKQFDVQQQVDPSLLGGVRIQMGDTAIDGTVAGKLDELSRALLAPK